MNVGARARAGSSQSIVVLRQPSLWGWVDFNTISIVIACLTCSTVWKSTAPKPYYSYPSEPPAFARPKPTSQRTLPAYFWKFCLALGQFSTDTLVSPIGFLVFRNREMVE